MTSLDQVGKNLTQVREARSLTKAQLARMIDMSPRAIIHYEQGTRTMGIDKLMCFSQVLKVPVGRLLSDA